MRTLSIRQPWAWAIITLGKDIENRDWSTGYRGPLLIHASKGMTRDEYEDFLHTAHMVSRSRPFPSGTTLPPMKELQRGGIVGRVDMVDCVSASDSPWFFGHYGFVLKNATPLPFVPYKGQLGFFDVDYEKAAREEEK